MNPTTNSLLEELNGKPGITEANVSEPKESTRDPLDVAQPPSAGPTAAKSDAVHSIKVPGGKGYRVVVVGDYYRPAKEGKGKVLARYELAFNLPYLVSPDGKTGALGIIVGKLLLPALQKKYPGAIGYRTHEVIKAEALTPDTPPTTSLQYMDRERLERYIADNSVPIKASEYPDDAVLREAVMDHKLNPKGFEEREAVKQADRRSTAELLAMNPDLAPEAKEPVAA